MNNILYCILHTKNQLDRYDTIVSTWAKKNDFIFYGDYQDEEKNVIKVSDRSDYASGEEKQVNIINRISCDIRYSQYDWYLFCDNDTFINTDKLNQLILTCDIDKLHGVVANSWPNDIQLFYCGGGAGILMHNTILKKLHNNIFVYNTGYSDVTLGIAVKKLGIKLNHQKSFHSFPPEHYGYNIEEIKQQTTFHYIKDLNTMKYLYENTKNNS